MGTGSAPDIHRRPHQARKGRLASDDLGTLFKSSRGPHKKFYPIEFITLFSGNRPSLDQRQRVKAKPSKGPQAGYRADNRSRCRSGPAHRPQHAGPRGFVMCGPPPGLRTEIYTWVKRMVESERSAFVSLERRVDILAQSHDSTGSHRSISRAAQIFFDPLHNVGGDAGFAGGLEERKLIQLVILIINNRIPGDPWMPRDPRKHLVSARSLGHIGAYIHERHSPVPCGNQTDGIEPPT